MPKYHCPVCKKWLTPGAWRYHLKSKIHLENHKLHPTSFIPKRKQGNNIYPTNRKRCYYNINKDKYTLDLLPPDEFDDMGHFIIRF